MVICFLKSIFFLYIEFTGQYKILIFLLIKSIFDLFKKYISILNTYSN